ncbi:CHAT domain-containing protein [Streptomyces sp. NPDC003480]
MLLFGVILVTLVTASVAAAQWLWADDDTATGRLATRRIVGQWVQRAVIAGMALAAMAEGGWFADGFLEAAVLVVPLVALSRSAHLTTTATAVAASAVTGWSVTPLVLAGGSLSVVMFVWSTERYPQQWHPLPTPDALHHPLQAARCRLCDRRIARGDLLGARRSLGSGDGPCLQLRRAFLDLEERLYQPALSLANDPALPAALSGPALILRGRALSGTARFDEARTIYLGVLQSLQDGQSRLHDYLALLSAENDFAAGDSDRAAQAAASLTTHTPDTCDYFMRQRALHLLAAYERDRGHPEQAAHYADQAMDAMIRNRALARLMLLRTSNRAARRLFGNRASMFLHVLRVDILSRSMTKRDDWEPEAVAMALATARAADDLVELFLLEARAAAASDRQQSKAPALVARALMELDRTRYLLAAQSSRSSWSRRFHRVLDVALSIAHTQQDHEFVGELLEFARIQTLPTATAEAPAQETTELELSTPPTVLVHGRSRLARPAERHRPPHVELTHAAERSAGVGAWWLSYWSSGEWLYWALVDPSGGTSSGRAEFGADSPLRRRLEDLERALPVILPGEHPAEADFRMAASPLLTDPAAELALFTALGELLLPGRLVHAATRRIADGHTRLPLAIAPAADLGHLPWSLLGAASRPGETPRPPARLIELCDWVLAPSAALVCNAETEGGSCAPLALAIVDTTDAPELGELAEARAQVTALPRSIRILGGAHWSTDLATLPQVEAALREIGPDSTVAFMCHAVRGDVSEPSKGGLVLARPETAPHSADRATEPMPASPPDVLGPLQIFAMRRRGLKMPSQVLLQACDTSALKDTASGEWLTIAPAFIAAGSREVVATLYPLVDLPGTDDPMMHAALAGSSLREAVGRLQRERLRAWNSGNAGTVSETPFTWGAYATVAVQPPPVGSDAQPSPGQAVGESLPADLARAIKGCLSTHARRLDSGWILDQLLDGTVADRFDGGDLRLRPSSMTWTLGPYILTRYLRMRDSGPATRLVANGHALHVPNVVIEAMREARAAATRDGTDNTPCDPGPAGSPNSRKPHPRHPGRTQPAAARTAPTRHRVRLHRRRQPKAEALDRPGASRRPT